MRRSFFPAGFPRISNGHVRGYPTPQSPGSSYRCVARLCSLEFLNLHSSFSGMVRGGVLVLQMAFVVCAEFPRTGGHQPVRTVLWRSARAVPHVRRLWPGGAPALTGAAGGRHRRPLLHPGDRTHHGQPRPSRARLCAGPGLWWGMTPCLPLPLTSPLLRALCSCASFNLPQPLHSFLCGTAGLSASALDG